MGITELLGMLGPIILILGLLYGTLILIRKFTLTKGGISLKNLKVKVLSNQMLLPKKYISLVRVEDKIMILGVSENSINLLKEIDFKEDDEIENIQNNNSFLEILKNKMSKE